MKKLSKWALFMMIFCIFFSTVACTKKPQKPNAKSSNEPKPMPKVIEEIEKDTLKIITQTDMVPYFKRVIVEKKTIEEEKKMEEVQMKIIQKTTEEGKQDQAPKTPTGPEQEQPKPKSIDESILTELLKREKTDDDSKEEEKPPKDIAETWKKINGTIKGIHDKWNVLEPLLMQESVSPELIGEFEDTLDTLTIQGINENYLGTITNANKLTSYLPKFMTGFKIEVPPTVYTLKFLTREVVLHAAIMNYPSAQNSLDKIKEYGQTMKTQLIEKKAKSTADKFDASLVNLQKSLDKKDIHLIKINSSILMKNIMLMKDNLSDSMK